MTERAIHTPGPWRVDDKGIRAIVRGDDGRIVATRHRVPAEEHEANACLIASAPDLLAACKEVLRRWTFDNNQQHTHSWHDMQDCAETIRAAIAKAEAADLRRRQDEAAEELDRLCESDR